MSTTSLSGKLSNLQLLVICANRHRCCPSSTSPIVPFWQAKRSFRTLTAPVARMAKRKRSEVAPSANLLSDNVASIISSVVATTKPGLQPIRRQSSRRTQPQPADIDTNPQENPDIEESQAALRASPDAEAQEIEDKKKNAGKRIVKQKITPATPAKKSVKDDSDSSLSDLSDVETAVKAKSNATKSSKSTASPKKAVEEETADPEAEDDVDEDPEELTIAVSRPPAVNSSYLPLPWKGRLGYACLNTYLRLATPPVFSSRTCRIASILEHRHPLKDPSQPEHSTKNRPDKGKPADVARGQAYVEALGVANAKDVAKMLRWNDKYNIKFFRLSSEMFPFASHDLYGYNLAPFASEALAEAGKVAAELGHRLTTHPGQFTQLGSPRPEVITAAIRDLEYHCELLDLLKLPPQQNRDAVMILHMGGVFGDKDATIARFKENYVKLSQGIKNRLVLENDDVCYTVHDLLPVCEELNIPLVLDYHHHNILFDPEQIREGTLDIMSLYDRIKATWTRKGITQKMHYSEPCPGAVTARQRRKHSPRVYSLPPCAPDMDLMIEAKDKEQAVFEVMRHLRLPGHELINDVVPYTRGDENKPWKPPKKKTPKKKKKVAEDEDEPQEDPEPQPPPLVLEEDIAMGGPENRVYWPLGFEEWLRPKKREVKARDPEKAKTTAEKAAQRRAEKAAWQAAREASAEGDGTEPSIKTESVNGASSSEAGDLPKLEIEKTKSVYAKSKASKAKPARAPASKKNVKAAVPTPSTSDHDEHDEDVSMPDLTDGEEEEPAKVSRATAPKLTKRKSSRGTKRNATNYAEAED